MKGRIGLRITSSILFIFSFILFLSGCVLQRQSVTTLEKYYDTMPLPETHPLALEKKRRLKKSKLQDESKQSVVDTREGSSYGDQQRMLLSSTAYSPAQRQQELERERYRSVGYVQIVTKLEEVCNAILVFADLEKVGSKASRVLMYPAGWDLQLDIPLAQQNEAQERLRKQLESGRKVVPKKSKKSYKSKGKKDVGVANAPNPLDPPPLSTTTGSTLPPHFNTARRIMHLARIRYSAILLPVSDSMLSPFTLLNMTDYSRLLYLSHPAQVLQNMDDMLFYTPPAIIAGPRYSSTNKDTALSPNFMLITPSQPEFEYLKKQPNWNDGTLDGINSILNSFYDETTMILPRRPYEASTSEFFESSSSEKMEGRRSSRTWSPKRIINEGYYILFDGKKSVEGSGEEKVPQPWKLDSMNESVVPKCRKVYDQDHAETGDDWDCSNKKTWMMLYEGYRQRRMEVCGLDLEA
ncbi:N-acetylglucosaminyltransferase [Orbilia ellipsospora]|uniref:N-acetylglucosaminyltransferase n=1 Tax=Orbilia ellipsospora TaxID=2528407 RepID=A0AAV9XMA7_9PEZI